MFIFIFVISALVRIWFAAHMVSVFWDSAMYIGIGKYFYSAGTIGFYELFRPPLLPIIFGAIWKIGLNPLLWSTVLMIAASIWLTWLIYKIGSKASPATGLLAAVLFGFMPATILYGSVPLSDIPSAAFIVLATKYALERKYWRAGIFSAAAFLTRFPAGIILAPLSIFILLDSSALIDGIKNCLRIVASFMLVTAPFWIVNLILYRNPLYPVTYADAVASNPVSAHGIDLLFYAKNILMENPFLILSCISLIPLYALARKIIATIKTKKEPLASVGMPKKVLLIASLCTLIIGGYFEFNTHDDIRFAILFLPYLSLISAYGIEYVFSKIAARKSSFNMNIASQTVAVIAMLCLLGICAIGYANSAGAYGTNPERTAFYDFFADKPGATVITTSPQAMVTSNVRVIAATDTWEDALHYLILDTSKAEYVAVDDCAPVCESDTTCQAAQSAYFKILQARTKVFEETAGSCHLEIYK